MKTWPNFFIVGATRAGTTSLYEYLKKIPSIYLPSIKEPSYFATLIDESQLFTKPIHDKEKYLKLFQDVKNEKAIGDASPHYLWDPNAAKLIHETVPHAKIIMILRDPIERAFSHYLMLFGTREINLTFEQAISESVKVPHDDFNGRIINSGFYSEQVKRYLNFFPRDQVKIFIFEEFFKDIEKSVQEVLTFLNVDDKLPKLTYEAYNQFTIPRGSISSLILKNKFIKKVGKNVIPLSLGDSTVKKVLGKKGTKKPELSKKTRNYLEDIYRNDITELKKILQCSKLWNI